MGKEERIRFLVVEDDDVLYAALLDRLEVIRSAQYDVVRTKTVPDSSSFDAALVGASHCDTPAPCLVVSSPARDQETDEHDDVDALRARILAIVGHELRSPITSLSGYCDFLIDNAHSEIVLDAAIKMRRTTRHLQDFVDNLCEFVRLDAGEATLNPHPFCFETLIREVVELFMPYARHKGVMLTYDVQSRTDATVFGDEMRIRQVLLNLVKNAITHTDGGAVDITAAISSAKLRVSVRDDGVGMQETAVSAVLGDDIVGAPNCEFGGGLGLGLPICRRLLKLMGGRLLLESAPGFGTIAGFEIALAPRGAAAKTTAETSDSPYWE